MKPRFSIRDLFWLVLVAALIVGWWLDHGKLFPRSSHEQVIVTEQLKGMLHSAQDDAEFWRQAAKASQKKSSLSP
jgi:hypothetical protein